MSGLETLHALQQASHGAADAPLRSSWPAERSLDEASLRAFLEERRYCVLATATGSGQPQARPVAFTVHDAAFWVASVAGGRLRNLERTPWGSLVISEGDGQGAAHRAVVAEGPVRIHARPGAELMAAWRGRFDSDPSSWAAAWLELRPVRLFSYSDA